MDPEEAVPPQPKATATACAMVADVLLDQPAWVRVNAARTPGAQRISTQSRGRRLLEIVGCPATDVEHRRP